MVFFFYWLEGWVVYVRWSDHVVPSRWDFDVYTADSLTQAPELGAARSRFRLDGSNCSDGMLGFTFPAQLSEPLGPDSECSLWSYALEA